MGQVTGINGKGKKEEPKKKESRKEEEEEEDEDENEEQEQDGLSVHSPCKPPLSSLQKEKSEVELELKLLEALEIYPPAKLQVVCSMIKRDMLEKFGGVWFIIGNRNRNGIINSTINSAIGIHRHFVLYGLTEYLRRSFNRQFTPDDVLKLLDRFYNLEELKPDDEDAEVLNHEEDFCLPESYFVKEES